MLISLEWLKEFVDWPETPAALAERLTGAGLTAAGWSGSAQEPVLELELTSNRPDCLSHWGVAREVAALARTALKPPAGAGQAGQPTDPAGITVTIESAETCARYCLRVLDLPSGAAARALPEIMRARLLAMGQAPIHLLPDLSNYTLFEIGQPTHVFDADTLRGNQLHVRWARPGETLITLDEVERQLNPGDLVIADAERPVALAGVIGGLETAITPATRKIAIESAWFEPQVVRRSARRHGIRTEAGYRFERGADPQAAAWAADLLVSRAVALAGAHWAGGTDCIAREWQAPTIRLRAEFLRRLLGLAPPSDAVENILQRLGFQLEAQAGASWMVQPPSWRADVKIEADLAEEVARLWGYEHFPSRLPAFQGVVTESEPARLASKTREKLRGRGYSEAISLSFAGAAEGERYAPGRKPVKMMNPLSEEEAWLRTTLLPSMLRLLLVNQNRDLTSARLFEIGKIYWREAKAGFPATEAWRLSLGSFGEVGGWNDRREYGFYELKGDIELLLAGFDLPGLEWRPASAGWCHPGRAAEIWANQAQLGTAGQLHPELAEELKFRRPPFLAELDLQQLLIAGGNQLRFSPPSRFPAAWRDFSFLFDDRVSWQSIQTALNGLRQPGWQGALLLELFRGGGIPAGQRSLLLRASWQLPDRTLREDEVQRAADELRATLAGLGGQQR